MEMAAELKVLRRYSFTWERIMRGCMVLAMIGMLCVGSRSYAKDSTGECKGRYTNSELVTIGLNRNTEDCRRIAKEVMLYAGGDARNLTAMQGTEVGIILSGMEEEMPIKEPAVTLSLLAEEEIITMLPSAAKEKNVIAVAEDENEGKKDIPIINIDEETVDDGGKESGAKEPADDGREESGAKEPAGDGGEESGAEGFGIREISGFLVDEDGYITGVTEQLNLTDGILIFAWDEGCVGIRAGALDGLAGCVVEIYIPPNILEIEPGALDEFVSGAYIEAAADHPRYYSEDGILYLRGSE